MPVDEQQALEIARGDASRAYGDLSGFRVRIEQRDSNWVVDFEPIDPAAQGGGPHYVISGETGEILSKRYEQ